MLNLLPLHITLKPSWQLVSVFTGLHLMAGLSVFLSALPDVIKALLGLLCGVSLVYYSWYYALRASRCSIIRIHCLNQDEWRLYLNNGCCYQACLSGDSVISTWGHVLYFQCTELHQSSFIVIITPDSLESVEFQALLLLLKNHDAPTNV